MQTSDIASRFAKWLKRVRRTRHGGLPGPSGEPEPLKPRSKGLMRPQPLDGSGTTARAVGVRYAADGA